MDSNIKNQESFAAGNPLAEPHFDEEATVLSARRVVPLERVESQVRTKRHLFLAGATTLAILLGAAAAIFLARLRESPEPVEISSSQAAISESNKNVEAQGGSSPSAVAEEAAPKQPDSASPTVEDGFSSDSKFVASRKHRILRRKEALADADAGHLAQDDQEARREERRARRLGREALVDGRKGKKDSRQGLFRIREIFEGAGRPD